MPKQITLAAATLSLAALIGAPAAKAASPAFFLTYHVERLDTVSLSLEACAKAAETAARSAGYSTDTKAFPGQLITVSGGAQDIGSYVVQCIGVEAKTVAVVQGIDYAQTAGPLAGFADGVFAAIKAAVTAP